MVPENTAALSAPRASPLRRWGVPAATRVWAAVTVPVKAPCTRRSATSASTLRTEAISINTRAPARLARTSMRRRPKRSAAAPQMGCDRARESGVAAAKADTQSLSAVGSVTPSCWM